MTICFSLQLMVDQGNGRLSVETPVPEVPATVTVTPAMGSESSTTVYSLDSPSFMVTVVGSTLTPAAASSVNETTAWDGAVDVTPVGSIPKVSRTFSPSLDRVLGRGEAERFLGLAGLEGCLLRDT